MEPKKFFIFSGAVASIAVGGGAAVSKRWLFMGGLLGVAVLAAAVWFLWVPFQKRRRADRLERSLIGSANLAVGPNGRLADDASNADVKAAEADLKKRLREAVATVRDSRIGELRGRAALYELPWYMLIGHSAAGKSSAVARAGLRFPLGEHHGKAVTGINGTRDCDWYFTSEGILLDTAGRYARAGSRADKKEWEQFLDLLRQHRPRAPINGVIVTASIDDLLKQAQGDARPDAIERHAADLRQRIHEVVERLQVSVPIYVIFTMADRIAGFSDFFQTLDADERAHVWGATLTFEPNGTADPAAAFASHFDTLVGGLRSHARDRMSAAHGDIKGSLLTMPLEFAGLKPLLLRFIDTLFEDTPFHFRTVFRGFYFTSAEQESRVPSLLDLTIARRFGLSTTALASPESSPDDQGSASHTGRNETHAGHAYFLHDLFRQVIFADAKLVKQVSTRQSRRRKMALSTAACLGTGLILAWFASAYRMNQQLSRNVQADFAEVKRLQADRIDLKSRLDALLVLQDRLQQLLAYRRHAPLALQPLYAGEHLLAAVRREYFAGMRQLMVTPVAAQIENYLAKVLATPATSGALTTAARLTMAAGASANKPAGSLYETSSAADKTAAYSALKAYLMLADARKAESAHLATQITRFWRQWLEEHRGTMTREELIERAEKLLSPHATLADEPDWPTIQPRAALVDDTRRLLTEAMQGMPARDRVYAEIVARASARFPAITVRGIVESTTDTTLTGSYAIPGAYSATAWNNYVRQAISDASRKALDTTDWVLQDAHTDDLTLSGSPEHVRKDLQALYASHYIDEWQRFLAGVGVAEWPDFGRAVVAMERLGDPEQSPLRRLLERARAETSWDSPDARKVAVPISADTVVGLTEKMPLPASVAPEAVDVTGPVTRAFAGLGRMVDSRDGAEAPLRGYLAALGRLRTQLHRIENEGDVGPGARRLVEATLQGKASELSDALRITDEHMLVGLPDAQRRALRPLLLRPLMQTFAALVPHAEAELNRVWTAQVYQPFQTDLSRKFPFAEDGRVEASIDEMGATFGPTGAIARFATEALAPVVERRGDVLTPRQWGERSIALSPSLLSEFAQWVAPMGTSVAGPQTLFQLMPEPTTAGSVEYTVTIGNQSLRYRNEPAQWSNFTWGGSSTAPQVRVESTTNDGRIVVIADYQGPEALSELVRNAQRTRAADGTHVLTWSKDGLTVGMRLKIVSSAPVDADGTRKRGLRGTQLPATIAGSPSQAIAEANP